MKILIVAIVKQVVATLYLVVVAVIIGTTIKIKKKKRNCNAKDEFEGENKDCGEPNIKEADSIVFVNSQKANVYKSTLVSKEKGTSAEAKRDNGFVLI